MTFATRAPGLLAAAAVLALATASCAQNAFTGSSGSTRAGNAALAGAPPPPTTQTLPVGTSAPAVDANGAPLAKCTVADANVATVDAATCQVTGRTPGTTQITAIGANGVPHTVIVHVTPVAAGGQAGPKTVDCAKLSTADCQQKVDQALASQPAVTGTQGSGGPGPGGQPQVIVQNCPDPTNFCKQLQTQPGVVVASTQAGPATGDGTISLSDVKFCAGGPAHAVYPYATEAEARTCFTTVMQPSSVNSSKDCAQDARVGPCSFKGTVADAQKTIQTTIPGSCICLVSSVAAQAGISWDGTPTQ